MSNKEIAKRVILNNLSNANTLEALNDMYEINNGNNQILLEHIKALKNIFEKAIEELKENK